MTVKKAQPVDRPVGRRVSFLISSALLLCITLAFFGDIIFSSEEEVLSRKGTDTFYEYVHARHFGFNELRQGNLPLWNPHIFSGMPFFGGFQPALLYPLNFPYLFLPLHRAINMGIVLHIFLSGLFMYLWTSYKRLHPFACLVSSVLLMFCGAHFFSCIRRAPVQPLHHGLGPPSSFSNRWVGGEALCGMAPPGDASRGHADIGRASAVRLLYGDNCRPLWCASHDRK